MSANTLAGLFETSGRALVELCAPQADPKTERRRVCLQVVARDKAGLLVAFLNEWLDRMESSNERFDDFQAEELTESRLGIPQIFQRFTAHVELNV